MVKSLLPSLKAALFVALAFCNSQIFAQATWSANGSSIVYTMRKVGIKTSSPLYDADVNGSLHSRTAVVDSILSAWRIMVADALSVGGNLSVSGNATINGTLNAGQISLSANSIASSTGNISFGNNNLSTTGTISSSNITSLSNDVAGLQTTAGNQQNEIDTLESLVGNIQSSQWQNNDTNIYFNSGFVGIGTSQPSEPLEISGRIKITGIATGIDTSVTPPSPAPSKSIIIDGGIDRITATSGTLDFDNTNLTTTGNIQSNSITTANLSIIDKIESDTMHARKSLEVNNSLKLVRDDAEMFAEVSTKDTAVALLLQKEAEAGVTIGKDTLPPPEERAKLTVIGNTRLAGNIKVSGDINTAGNISANNVSIANNFTTSKVVTNRVTSSDSLIFFGDSSIIFNHFSNKIYPSLNTTIKGICFGSSTIGATPIGAITIGTGASKFNPLFNYTSNSLVIGFNSDIATVFVGPSSGTGTTGVVRIGTSFIYTGPHTDYKLSVDGKIVAKKIVNTELNWADDELKRKLTLYDLDAEEKCVKENFHLTGVPPEEEIKKNGIEMGEISSLQMRKTEQIFLYLFEFRKEITALKKENDELKKQVEILKVNGK